MTDTALQSTTLAEDWAVLLGSHFNDHGVGGKSKSHSSDIRQMLIALEKPRSRAYRNLICCRSRNSGTGVGR